MTRTHPVFILLLLLLVAGIVGLGILRACDASPEAVGAEVVEDELEGHDGSLEEEDHHDAVSGFRNTETSLCCESIGYETLLVMCSPIAFIRSLGWKLPLRL